MHPIEHLRYVARATGADPALVASEAASALAEMVRVEPSGLVPACRRLIERHVSSGPVWWLSARMLGAEEPSRAAREAERLLRTDPTSDFLADTLPDSTSVLLVGWPDLTAEAVRARGDVEVFVVSSGGEGDALARRLEERGFDAALIPDSGVGPAATVAGLVVVEAMAAGPSGALAAPGSLAAAAVAAHREVPVWGVAGVGRVLPERLWDALLARLDSSGDEPWDRRVELVPANLLSQMVGPDGLTEVGAGLAAATCPAAPELFRPAG